MPKSTRDQTREKLDSILTHLSWILRYSGEIAELYSEYHPHISSIMILIVEFSNQCSAMITKLKEEI